MAEKMDNNSQAKVIIGGKDCKHFIPKDNETNTKLEIGHEITKRIINCPHRIPVNEQKDRI